LLGGTAERRPAVATTYEEALSELLAANRLYRTAGQLETMLSKAYELAVAAEQIAKDAGWDLGGKEQKPLSFSVAPDPNPALDWVSSAMRSVQPFDLRWASDAAGKLSEVLDEISCDLRDRLQAGFEAGDMALVSAEAHGLALVPEGPRDD
jgi:hypothetical protein